MGTSRGNHPKTLFNGPAQDPVPAGMGLNRTQMDPARTQWDPKRDTVALRQAQLTSPPVKMLRAT